MVGVYEAEDGIRNVYTGESRIYEPATSEIMTQTETVKISSMETQTDITS